MIDKEFFKMFLTPEDQQAIDDTTNMLACVIFSCLSSAALLLKSMGQKALADAAMMVSDEVERQYPSMDPDYGKDKKDGNA